MSIILASRLFSHRYRYRRLHCRQPLDSASLVPLWQGQYCDGEDLQYSTVDALVYEERDIGGFHVYSRPAGLEKLPHQRVSSSTISDTSRRSQRLITHPDLRHRPGMGSQSYSSQRECGRACLPPHRVRRWCKSWLHIGGPDDYTQRRV